MSSTKVPARGEIWLRDFAPTTGHEMTGLHPCIVVQNDVANRHSALTIVAAITSNPRVAFLPVGVSLKAGTGGILKDIAIHCGHLYTVDKNRLNRRIGMLPAETVAAVDEALVFSLGLVK